MRHEDRSSGLTLIEMLVSISILTVVVGAILMTIYSGILVWERAGGYDMRRMEAMIALERLERDARNAIPFYGINFRGDATGVSFAGIVSETTADGRVRRVCEIEYVFDSKTHAFRRRSRKYPFDLSEDGEAAHVISGVESVRITYADLAGKQAGSFIWVEEWGNGRRLPAALRIELEFQGSDGPMKISRTIDLPVRMAAEPEAGGIVDDAA